MHRSCSLGLPAPRNLPAVPGAAWEPEDLASLHRRRGLPPGAVLADGHRAGPHRLERGHHAARRGADGRADARPADPRGRRPVGAARRPAAGLRRVVRADLRAQARRGVGRAAAADEQGPLAGPALHRRARAGAAAVAGPPGRPGAGDRRRDDVGLHRAGHPGARRGGGSRCPGRPSATRCGSPSAAGAVQAEGRDRAPRGAVRDGPGVHPRRAAGRRRVHAPRLGASGRPRAVPTATAEVGDRRGILLGETVHGHPAPGRVGPVDGAGDPRRLGPDGDGRGPGWR